MQNQQQQDDMSRLLASAYEIFRACTTLQYGMEYNAGHGGPARDAPMFYRTWLAMAAAVFEDLRRHYGQYEIGGEHALVDVADAEEGHPW
mmetsp:Transcript_16957/g.30685  ORF Transcript_16957/g.30685 Transcript_16957/m.30685 type:complete len:90 (+) Transcript_16957:78-347(+)